MTQKQSPEVPKRGQPTKEDRLAKALRDNLRRRKGSGPAAASGKPADDSTG